MNKKHLVVAVIVTALSAVGAYASNISGVSATNHTYNINPAKQHGSVGYRSYQNFQLSEGDIANLIYKYGSKNVETFINLVNNQIDINGVVNTMRDGKFHNGHAVFISPKGLVVGESGVLNVGTLSAITPSATKYNSLISDYNKNDYTVINNISQLKKSSNAPIDVKGKIFARKGVDLRGSNINVAGNILNGVKAENALTSSAQADALFSTLVNTNGVIAADQFVNNGSAVVIKNSNVSGAGIKVTGRVANYSGGETAITNHGVNGLTATGVVDTKGVLNLYNNSTNSAMTVGGKVNSASNTVTVNNQGTNLVLNSTTNMNAGKNTQIVNNGAGSTSIAGTVKATKNVIIANNTSNGAMTISGNVGNISSTEQVRILNRGGQLNQTGGTLAAKNEVAVINDGAGMTLSGTENSAKKVAIYNRKGNLAVNGKVNVTKGDVEIWNTSAANALTIGKNAQITDHGHLAVKNEGKGGLTINGTLTNSGENVKTAINNTQGAMAINGNITNGGNMGIINKGKGTSLTIAEGSTIKNTGKLKLVNNSGTSMNVNGTVNNSNGSTYLYNDKGQLNINGTVANKEGNLYVASRSASTGITTGANSSLTNSNGVIAIKNYGTNGMKLAGKVQNTGAGATAINNYKGDMNVGGNIVVGGNLGVINRAGGANMTSTAAITNSNAKATSNIKNYGTGNMTVNGSINNKGRVNVLANKGALNLGSKVTNSGMFYAASRANGTGINVTNTFNANSTGDVLIKNISGKNGLTYNGTITNKGGQSALVNKVGAMNVNGTIKSTDAPTIVSNFGTTLTTGKNSVIESNKEVKVVNRGQKEATLNGTVNAPENTKWFYEKLQ